MLLLLVSILHVHVVVGLMASHASNEWLALLAQARQQSPPSSLTTERRRVGHSPALVLWTTQALPDASQRASHSCPTACGLLMSLAPLETLDADGDT